MITKIIAILFAWTLVGLIIYTILGKDTKIDTDHMNWLTPPWIYRHYKVNYFGTFCLTLLFNLMCPIISIIFWFYILCTIGRKAEVEDD